MGELLEKLERPHDRTALHPWEMDADELRALEAAETPAEAGAFDHEAHR